MAAHVDRAPKPGQPLTREQIASSLLTRRDALVRQLPRQIKLARLLTADQQDTVIDEAVDYLVTENHGGEIADLEALERAFWKVAFLRVRHAYDGRHNLVRAGWKRVPVENVDLADAGSNPEDAAILSFERETLIEFAAELTPEQHTVLSVKYLGERELGRFAIASQLGWSMHRVRSSERVIQRRLKRFGAVLAAGSLCDDRQPAIERVAQGIANDREYRVAKAHLKHCSECRGSYADLVRAIRSGHLQREIAQLLPVPALDIVDRHRGPWEIIVDWISRPFGHDAAVSAGQFASAGRGLGGFAAVKLAALCMSGAVAGLFCVAQVPRQVDKHPRAISTPKPTATATATPRRTAIPTVTVAATVAPTRTPRPTPTARPKPKGGELSRSGPKSHEKARAISPPVTAPDGSAVDEFEPGPATSAPRKPAAAPANGGPEFF